MPTDDLLQAISELVAAEEAITVFEESVGAEYHAARATVYGRRKGAEKRLVEQFQALGLTNFAFRH